MAKNIKRILLILTLAVALLAFIIHFVVPGVIMVRFYYADLWAQRADFEGYESEFVFLKDYFLQQYPSEYGKYLSVSGYFGELSIYDREKKETLSLSDEATEAFETVCENGFPHKDSDLYAIIVYGDKVYFSDLNYALVYSPNGKPDFFRYPDDGEDIKVKKVAPDWYHVIIEP